MTREPDGPKLPPRIVHLLGGLRAVDLRRDTFDVQLAANFPIAQFPNPPYAQLYRNLVAFGLRPIGVEFVSQRSLQGFQAADWQCASQSEGFKIRIERDAWDGVRHAALVDCVPELADFASSVSTYLDLLAIRIRQLSDAYNRALCAKSASGENDHHYFSDTFTPYIDAAIHGFVADAASFRDLVVKGVWTYVLREPSNDVTSTSTFIKRAASHAHPLAKAIVSAGQSGQWLKNFTELRNHITHAAPLGRDVPFHLCVLRKIQLGSIGARVLHFPLLDANGTIWRSRTDTAFDDEVSVCAGLTEYRNYAETSLDALEYAWLTLGKLVDFSAELRKQANLRGELVALTEKDLAGPITRL